MVIDVFKLLKNSYVIGNSDIFIGTFTEFWSDLIGNSTFRNIFGTASCSLGRQNLFGKSDILTILEHLWTSELQSWTSPCYIQLHVIDGNMQ